MFLALMKIMQVTQNGFLGDKVSGKVISKNTERINGCFFFKHVNFSVVGI